MAITRTPIIDDDGTGTTGTVIDNAWKTELYNQIDGGLGAAGAATLIGSAAGTTASVAVSENLDFQTVPVLTNKDSVLITVIAFSGGGTAPIALDVLPVINDVAADPFLLTGASGAGDLSPSFTVVVRALVRPIPADNNAYIEWLATGAATVGTGQSRAGFTFAKLTVASLATAGAVNRLYFRQVSGVSAGGLLSWSWSVHLLKG